VSCHLLLYSKDTYTLTLFQNTFIDILVRGLEFDCLP
jgi:hypothetical protein